MTIQDFKKIILLIIFTFTFIRGINNARISIMPEYNFKGITILFQAENETFLEDSSLFSLPNTADSVFRIIYDQNNIMELKKKKITSLENRKWITLPSDSGVFAFMIKTQVFKENIKREFKYDIIFTNNVSNLSVEVQKPLRAKNFLLLNEEFEFEKNSNGTSSHFFYFDSITMGSGKKVFFEYTKDSALENIQNENNDSGIPNENILKEEPLRHRLYIWEPIIALSVLSIVVLLISLISNLKILDYCKSCNIKINTKDKFCKKCGEEI